MSKNQRSVNFKYIKSDGFKTVQIDGVIGGMTVKGHLNMNFYIDAPELPKTVKHNIMPSGHLGPELPAAPLGLEMTSLREVQLAVNIDILTARTIIQWMQNHLNKFEIENNLPPTADQ